MCNADVTGSRAPVELQNRASAIPLIQNYKKQNIITWYEKLSATSASDMMNSRNLSKIDIDIHETYLFTV